MVCGSICALGHVSAGRTKQLRGTSLLGRRVVSYLICSVCVCILDKSTAAVEAAVRARACVSMDVWYVAVVWTEFLLFPWLYFLRVSCWESTPAPSLHAARQSSRHLARRLFHLEENSSLH